MEFGNSSIWVLSLLWLIPLILLFYFYAFRKKARLIKLFCKGEMKDLVIPRHSPAKQWFKSFLIVLGILSIIFALMRPRWGFHWEEIKRVGIDIIVAVDCSQSMLAEDVMPNRLERAKREIQDLLNMLDGDRIGLIAFAGTSFVQCPLTLDYGAFRIFLDYLDTDLIPVQGTAMSQAIIEAIGCFDRTQKGSKAIILITDGEEHEGDPLEAATEAKNKGIKIFPIGIGKEGGAPIPERDGSGFKKDSKGNVILTKLDERTLQRIALETGGSYVRSVTGDLDLEKIYLEGIKGMEQRELASTKKRIWEERFQWFLLIAVIFLLIELVLPDRKGLIGKSLSRPSLTLLAFMLIPLLCTSMPCHAGILPSSKPKDAARLYEAEEYDKALSTYLDAQIDSPGDPLLQYNIGNTYYKMGNFEEASNNFLSAANSAKDINLEERAYYNLGNCAYKMGKLDEAVNWYMKALELNPDDEDAKYNLEYVRNEIKRRINEAMNQQKDEQQKQEGEEQNKGCQSPSAQGEGEKQEGTEEEQKKQGEQQQAQAGDKKEDEGGEEKRQGQKEQGGEELEEKQKAQSGEGTEEEKQGEIREAAKAGTDADKKEGEEEQGYQAQGYEKISPQEAERLLDSLDEERKEAMKKQQVRGRGPSGPLKDW